MSTATALSFFLCLAFFVSASPGFTNCTAFPINGTFPFEPQNAVRICRNGRLAISYDVDMINPAWTAYYVTPAEVRINLSGRKNFYRDPDLYEMGITQASSSSCAFSSDWNRGHLAPSRIFSWSDDSKKSTYTMANVAPQGWYFNQQPWRTLEAEVVEWVENRSPLYIMTGVAYIDRSRPQDSGCNNITIPDFFWKVICDVAAGESAGFFGVNNLSTVNAPIPFNTVSHIESLYGGLLFPDNLCNTGRVNESYWWGEAPPPGPSSPKTPSPSETEGSSAAGTVDPSQLSDLPTQSGDPSLVGNPSNESFPSMTTDEDTNSGTVVASTDVPATTALLPATTVLATDSSGPPSSSEITTSTQQVDSSTATGLGSAAPTTDVSLQISIPSDSVSASSAPPTVSPGATDLPSPTTDAPSICANSFGKVRGSFTIRGSNFGFAVASTNARRAFASICRVDIARALAIATGRICIDDLKLGSLIVTYIVTDGPDTTTVRQRMTAVASGGSGTAANGTDASAGWLNETAAMYFDQNPKSTETLSVALTSITVEDAPTQSPAPQTAAPWTPGGGGGGNSVGGGSSSAQEPKGDALSPVAANAVMGVVVLIVLVGLSVGAVFLYKRHKRGKLAGKVDKSAVRKSPLDGFATISRRECADI